MVRVGHDPDHVARLVVLGKPSLATRVALAHGIATEEQERAWTLAAKSEQREVLTRLAFKGAPIEPEHAYYRVFNGFATALDARSRHYAAEEARAWRWLEETYG